MFHVELAPLGGILGPLKSDLGVFWAKIPLYPYNVKTQKNAFSQNPFMGGFSSSGILLYIYIHLPKNQKNYHRQFFVS